MDDPEAPWPRAKNCAGAKDYEKVVRANMTKWMPTTWESGSREDLATTHESFLLDLARLTPRPLKHLLAGAAQTVLDAPRDEAEHFAERVIGTFRFARRKGQNITSGKKTTRSVMRLADILRRRNVGSGKFVAGTRRLLRRSSAESNSGARGPPPPANRKGSTLPPDLSRSNSAASSLATPRETPPVLEKKPVLPSMPARVPSAKSRVFALYGLMAPQEPEDDEVEAISSGAENLDTPPPTPPLAAPSEPLKAMPSQAAPRNLSPSTGSAPGASGTVFLDGARCVLVRMLPGGQRAEAEMRRGPHGFALGRFPGEENDIPTEVPNLDIQDVAGSSSVAGQASAPMEPLADSPPRPVAGQPKKSCKKRPAAAYSDEEQSRAAPDGREPTLADAPAARVAEGPGESPAAASPTAAAPKAPENRSVAAEALPAEAAPAAESAGEKNYCVLYYKNDGAFAMRRCFGARKQIWSLRTKAAPADQVREWMNEARDRLRDGSLEESASKAWVLAKLPP